MRSDDDEDRQKPHNIKASERWLTKGILDAMLRLFLGTYIRQALY